MRGTRAVLVLFSVVLAGMVAAALAFKSAMKTHSSSDRAAHKQTVLSASSLKNPHRYRTLGELMAANYGWKAPAAAKPSGARPAVARKLEPAPTDAVDKAKLARDLAAATNSDDVCKVDRLLALAGKDAAVLAFLEPGQSRRLDANEEDALRALLDPNARADVLARAAGSSSYDGPALGLRFLDALDQSRLLRAPEAPSQPDSVAALTGIDKRASISQAPGSADALDDLAREDSGNGAFAFFAMNSSDPGRAAQALESNRFETGIPEILELLAKQGLASASHLYLSTYISASLPMPNWSKPLNAIEALLQNQDSRFAQSAIVFGERLQDDAQTRAQRSPATRRFDQIELQAGARIAAIASETLGENMAIRGFPSLPPEEPHADVKAAIRKLAGPDGCDRYALDRALLDERSRLGL